MGYSPWGHTELDTTEWLHSQTYIYIYIYIYIFWGDPRWRSGKESTCQCRRCGFDPWVRKTALQEENGDPL